MSEATKPLIVTILKNCQDTAKSFTACCRELLLASVSCTVEFIIVMPCLLTFLSGDNRLFSLQHSRPFSAEEKKRKISPNIRPFIKLFKSDFKTSLLTISVSWSRNKDFPNKRSGIINTSAGKQLLFIKLFRCKAYLARWIFPFPPLSSKGCLPSNAFSGVFLSIKSECNVLASFVLSFCV